MDELVKKDLEKQGYRIVGDHSAIKVCSWTKKSLRDEGYCYKEKFYGLKSHRCVQSSVSVLNCHHQCVFCWRSLEHTQPMDVNNANTPEEILKGLIKAHRLYLIGFAGNDSVDQKKLQEALNPKHIALSLSGDATLYPQLPELVELIKKKSMTAFLVTNGQNPEMLKRVNATQTYITLPAPNKEVYLKTCKPYYKDGWERLMKSLDLISTKERGTVRLSVLKGLNLCDAEGYAEIIKKCNPMFVEVKAVMAVGYASYRVDYTDMAKHEEVKEFSLKLSKLLGWPIVAEKTESRVCLLMKEDKDRFLKN